MTVPTPPRGIQKGTVLAGRYVAEERIGAGGMGTVFRARHTDLDRPVAIKLIGAGRGATDAQAARFEREARLLARLSHPAIVTVHDFGRAEDGTLFLVLELVDGEDLATRLRRAPVPWREAAGYALSVAEALAYAHDEGVLHRDLKPSNIMLLGRAPGLKVIDFGLARLHSLADESESGDHLTESAYVVGTPGYIAPEYAATGAVSPAVDHYALGITVAEMLLGEHPFGRTPPRSDRLVSLRAQLEGGPEPPPAAFVDVVLRLLDSVPERRAPVLDELRAFVTPTAPRPPQPGRRATTAERPTAEQRSRRRAEVHVDGGVVHLLVQGRFVEVRVPPFTIDKHLVTQGDYWRFVKATGARLPRGFSPSGPSRADRSLPVVGVSYDEAEAYAAWMGRRLPTEAEWELAARGPRAFLYPWGDRWTSGLSHNVHEQAYEDRTPGPIGVFSPQGDSPFGVSDLVQLWEWVTAPYQADGHLVRGGPWRDRNEPACLENRSWEDEPAHDVGFRCAGP